MKSKNNYIANCLQLLISKFFHKAGLFYLPSKTFYVFYFFLILGIKSANCQVENGLPFIRLYLSNEYKAHTQNFSIVQDQRGVMYFGNFAGVLEYDGIDWRIIPTQSRVSALLRSSSNKIYVGTNNEIGYLDADSVGNYVFVPIKDTKSTNYGQIISILEYKKSIYFISKNKIVSWSTDTKQIKSQFSTNTIRAAFLSNNKPYIVQENGNLMVLNNGNYNAIEPSKAIINNIVNILPLNSSTDLIVTRSQGIYKLVNGKLLPFVQLPLLNTAITKAIMLHDNIIVWSANKGFITISKSGKIISINDIRNELNNEGVNYIYKDNFSNIWLALDNGIVQVNSSSPLSIIPDRNTGIVNDLKRYNGRLYAATSKGLYYLKNSVLVPIYSFSTGCWSLAIANNSLYVASAKGVYQITGNTIKQISNAYSFSVKRSNLVPNTLYTGAESSLSKVLLTNSENIIPILTKLPDNVVGIEEEKAGSLWFQTLSHGVFKYSLDNKSLKSYAENSGLGTSMATQLLRSSKGLLAYNANGVFIYNESKDLFTPFAADTFGSPKEKWFAKIIENPRGDFWTTKGDEKQVTLFEKQGIRYSVIRKPFLPISGMSFRTIYPEGDSLVWFGGTEGIVQFNRVIKAQYDHSFQTLIRKIVINGDSLRTIFNGYATDNSAIESILPSATTIFKSNFSGLTIQFAAPSYMPNNKIQFKYRLVGLDDRWSEWSSQSSKDYSKLPYGSYTFQVKARDIYEIESKQASFSFTIETPFYVTWWAYTLYTILSLVVLLAFIRWRTRKADLERQELENLIKERTEEIVDQKVELERQSEELAVKNDQLEKIDLIIQSINAEIDFNNLFQTILSRFTVIRNMDSATVMIYDKDSDSFRFRALRGSHNLSYVESVQLTLDQAENRYLSQAVEVYEGIFVKNNVEYERLNNSIDDLTSPKSLITIVIINEGKTEGFITLENNIRAGAFDQRDIAMIRHLKEHLIAAYIKTRILEDLEVTLKNLENTQEELIRQEKLASVGQLTKGIVDRILNPLNYVTNFSESSDAVIDEMITTVEANKDGLAEEQIEDLIFELNMLKNNSKKIQEHGNSTTRILKDMQKLLKEKSTEFIETDFNSFIETRVKIALTEIKNDYADFHVNIAVSTEERNVKVRVLPYEFGQVVTSIINNSYYALYEKSKSVKNFSPEVQVATKVFDTHIFITFRDNGKGIPPRDLERLFSPFFTTKPTSKGTGLGLFMTKDIIETHKGKIEINSKEGEFTEIRMALPMIS